jgi:hypothetical protein
MSEFTFCWRHLGSLLLALALSLGLTTGSADAQDFVEYDPDLGFEKWVRKANSACMPKPFKISTDPYAYRLLAGVYGECAPSHYNPATGSFDKPNMTEEEAEKWAALAIGSLVNPAIAAYASGEVLTAGGKCVLRSFIDASDTATPKTKESRLEKAPARHNRPRRRSYVRPWQRPRCGRCDEPARHRCRQR